MTRVRDMLAGNFDTARQVAVDAYQAMNENEQQFLDGIALTTVDLFKTDKGGAVTYFRAQILDNEERLAIWSLLPSYIRAAIKREQ